MIVENPSQGIGKPQPPLSGRYEGEMVLPQPGRFLLDLRIDVDAIGPNSPVMNRISGDAYQISRIAVPGKAPLVSKTYLESWIVDQPDVTLADDHAEIRGTVRFWTTTHPATTVVVQVARGAAQAAQGAVVTFGEEGGTQRSFACRRISGSFRTLGLEIDVCQSVHQPPLNPAYDTDWHQDRPADLQRRTLTIENAYAEAGVSVAIDPEHTVIDDSAPDFASWTAAELHDAMATHYSRFGGTWPNWAMWGVMAGKYEQPAVGGVMFDAASEFGGAGEGPERQGFAVFRKHEWFNNLADGVPNSQEQAWALRHFLYTWVHEAGHAFNLLHSWDKARPDSVSWMNYDWRYEQRNGVGTFWKRFAFRFDDDELIHIRHGNRSSVIMGGDPWSSGSHLEGPNLALTQVEGSPPIELLIRSKGTFDLLEPVIIELRVRNLIPDTSVVIDELLAPEYGGVVINIQRPDGTIVKYEPVMCALATPTPRLLAPASTAETGDDRYSREVFVSYGAKGFYFDQPGEYRIRAAYQGLGDVLIPSNTHRLRVGAPSSKEADRLAQDYFSNAVGLSLYLQGSRSPFLRVGADFLHELADRMKGSVEGTNIAMALANGVSKPFFRLADPNEPRVVKTAEADPKEALKLTEDPLKVLRRQNDKSFNLAYGRVVRRRAKYHEDAGSPAQARAELRTLQDDLAKRGANAPVLALYKNMETKVEPAVSSGRNRIAARPTSRPAGPRGRGPSG